jgi:GAF domain-containing protein
MVPPAESTSDVARRAMLAYALAGQYCETAQIGARLEELREEADATAVVLLAWREQTFFHSLLLLRHRDPAAGRKIEAKLVSGTYQPQSSPPFWELFRPEIHDEQWLADQISQTPLLASIRESLAGHRLTAIRAAVDVRRSESGLDLTPASAVAVLVEPRRSLTNVQERRAAEDVAMMINVCAPVVVHGNLAAESAVDRALEPFDDLATLDSTQGNEAANGQADLFAELPQDILDIALKLTGSTVGNVYLDAREAPHLRLAAATENARPFSTIEIADTQSVVAWVYRRRRPMVINDIRDFQRLHPTGRYLSVTEPGASAYAELAVPVFQSSVGQSVRNVIGVINVEKIRRSDGSGDSGYYSYRDLTMLRSVATQLSLWQSHALLNSFSRSLAKLTRRHTVRAYQPNPIPDARAAPPGIPADATGAHSAIAETLRSLYDVTRTYSAAVRLISPDQSQLVRFAAYPSERQHDPHPSIAVGDRGSVNSWVAREGVSCYLRNRRETKALAGYRGLDDVMECRDGIVAELCLPIFVSGRVVGTLNLESRYRDAYADHVEIANAFVEQIGLAVAHARRTLEQEVYSLSIATTANLHQVYRHVDRLKAHAKGDADLLAIAFSIENAVAAETLVQEPAVSTVHLVEQVLRQLHFDAFFDVGSSPIELMHSGTEALILRIVFEELFRNAHAEAIRTRLDCTVKWRIHRVGGKQYLGISIHNPLLRKLHPAASTLYRAPVRYRSGRQHIGAFLSGALVRSIGGEIWAESDVPPHFIVRLDIPIDRSESVRKAA